MSFFERSPEQVYFQSLEELMIEHRGAPLQLSPDDWQISKRWYQEKIPLDVVGDVLSSVVEKRRAKEQEIPRRLSFYRRAVEEAWKRIGGLSAPGTRRDAPDFDLGGRLERLATALERADSEGWSEDLATTIRGASSEGADIEAVEDELGRLDQLLLERAMQALGEEEAARLEAKVRGALVAYEDRSPEPPSPTVEKRLRAEALRGTLGIPILSLFAPEASNEVPEHESAP